MGLYRPLAVSYAASGGINPVVLDLTFLGMLYFL